jgi:hypothetical protein
MARALEIRIGFLEAQLKELRRNVELGAKYGTHVSSEVLYRMWQAEREDNTRLRLLMQEREREYEAFKERVLSGLQLLYDRAGEISARMSAVRQGFVPDPIVTGTASNAAEQRILEKFRAELRKGTGGYKLD